MKNRLSAEDGFTFLELLIGIALVGALAALAYPKLQLFREQLREKATQNNLLAIKAAISIYYGDHDGIWPGNLDVNDRTPGWGFGDYLAVMPKVKTTHYRDPAKSPAGNQVVYKSFTDEPSLAVPGSAGAGWRYDGPGQSNTGRIWVNSSYLDTQGISYTTYGYQ